MKPNDRRQSVWALIDRDRLDVFFQSIVTRGIGRVYGSEALLRPVSPSGRRLSPRFVHTWAQSTGEERELDRVVLERALRANPSLCPGQHLFLDVVPQVLPGTIEFLLHQNIR